MGLPRNKALLTRLVKAFCAGQISARSVSYFVRLSRPKQLAELRRRQNTLAQHTERCRQVTEFINAYLDSHEQIELESLRQALTRT